MPATRATASASPLGSSPAPSRRMDLGRGAGPWRWRWPPGWSRPWRTRPPSGRCRPGAGGSGPGWELLRRNCSQHPYFHLCARGELRDACAGSGSGRWTAASVQQVRRRTAHSRDGAVDVVGPAGPATAEAGSAEARRSVYNAAAHLALSGRRGQRLGQPRRHPGRGCRRPGQFGQGRAQEHLKGDHAADRVPGKPRSGTPLDATQAPADRPAASPRNRTRPARPAPA